jgi:hypothetical protein
MKHEAVILYVLFMLYTLLYILNIWTVFGMPIGLLNGQFETTPVHKSYMIASKMRLQNKLREHSYQHSSELNHSGRGLHRAPGN